MPARRNEQWRGLPAGGDAGVGAGGDARWRRLRGLAALSPPHCHPPHPPHLLHPLHVCATPQGHTSSPLSPLVRTEARTPCAPSASSPPRPPAPPALHPHFLQVLHSAYRHVNSALQALLEGDNL